MVDFEVGLHGVGVTVQGIDSNVKIRRFGNVGTTVTQPKGTDNWFHFALTTPLRINGTFMNIDSVWLRFSINNEARIDRIGVSDEVGGIYDERVNT